MLLGIPWLEYVPALLEGILNTLKFTASGFLTAGIIGFVIAVMRLSHNRLMKAFAAVYTEFLKNVPVLSVLFIVYFGLGSTNITLTSFQAGTISLAVSYGAYLSEVFRAALQGVSRHQREAAQAVGLSRSDTLLRVIVPQATRLALPATGTMLVDLLKATSLLITIGGNELMTQAQLIASDTFRPLPVYTVIGLIYFGLCFPLSRLVHRFEARLESGKPILPARKKLFSLVQERAQAS